MMTTSGQPAAPSTLVEGSLPPLPVFGALFASVAVGLDMSIDVEVEDGGGFEAGLAPNGTNADPLAGYNGFAG